MTKKISCLAALSLFAWSNSLYAQSAVSNPTTGADEPNQRITMRAVGQEPTEEVVAAVAQFGETASITPEDFPKLENASVAEIIEEICGSIQPGYLDALKTENSTVEIELDLIPGEVSQTLRWPACVYSTRDPTITSYRIKKGESPTEVMESLTGFGKKDEEKLETVLGSSNSKRVIEGEQINGAFRTFSTPILPKHSIQDVKKELARIEKITGGILKSEVTQINANREPSPEPLECSPTDGTSYPFSPELVHEIFDFMALRVTKEEILNPILVGVFDNGFFGVPCNAGECPQKDGDNKIILDEPFPSYFFGHGLFDNGFGPTVTWPNNKINPLNYYNGMNLSSIDEYSGHGTHVTGLVIGGAHFKKYRDRVFNWGNRKWLKLGIVNLAPGKREFDDSIHDTLLLSWLKTQNKAQIINMSFDLTSASKDKFGRIIDQSPDTLFVVSAGNNQARVKDQNIYPAMYGGGGKPNLMTVASVDASGEISRFSNWDRQHVDIAAPGCQISSWLSGNDDPVKLNGTSQATPLVTFGATMIRTLSKTMKSPQVRERLIYSGDVIPLKNERNKTKFGVKLNLWKSLLIKDDYLAVKKTAAERQIENILTQIWGIKFEPSRRYLGRLEPVSINCAADQEYDFNWQEIASFKRHYDSGASLFHIYADTLRRCKANLSENVENQNLYFAATHRLDGSKLVKLDQVDEIVVKMSDVMEFVQAPLD